MAQSNKVDILEFKTKFYQIIEKDEYSYSVLDPKNKILYYANDKIHGQIKLK